MRLGKRDVQDVRPVAPVVREVAEIDVVGPVQGIAAPAETGMSEVCLPGIVVSPIKRRRITSRNHGIAKTLRMRIHVVELVLAASIAVEVVDPFDTDGYRHRPTLRIRSGL